MGCEVENGIATALLGMGFPCDAVAFIVKYWRAIQFLDDVKDGAPTSDADGAIYLLLIELPYDDFLAKHRTALGPCVATAVHKWQAANMVERQGATAHLDKSFMWRAGFYDAVLTVATLCMPADKVAENRLAILSLYGESHDKNVSEFS
jgi:hypothetical protein